MAASVRTFAEEDTRPLKVFFQDEARFGRMSNPARCWAPAGFRPIVPMQRVREYTYIYGAVCPADGDSFSLILPSANTEMMTLYLREFSLFYKDYRIVMVMDGAPWHKAKDLETFENIRIVFQPSYSPELNPAEHLWEHLRENYLQNGFWTSMGELEKVLMKALIAISYNKEIIQSLAGFHWAVF